MSTILTLIRKDLSLFMRDRTALTLTFLVPVVMIYVFGLVFGYNRKESGPTGIPLALVNDCTNPAAQRLVDALRAEKGFSLITTTKNEKGVERPLTTADLKPLMYDNAFRFAVVIPADLIATEKIGVNLKLLSNPSNEIETQVVNGLLQKNIFSNVPQLIGQSMQQTMKTRLGGAGQGTFNRDIADAVSKSFDVDANEVLRNIESGNFGLGDALGEPEKKSDNDGMRELGVSSTDKKKNTATHTDTAKSSNPFGGIINIEREQVIGKDVKSPNAARSIGGWAIMFLLFSLSHSASSLFEEKRAGLFQRFFSSPVRPWHVLVSKFAFGVLLGVVQLLALFLASQLMFDIDVVSHLLPLALVCLASGCACTGFGMFIASIARTPAAAGSLTTLIVLLMSCLGGAWIPLSMMPLFIQKIGVFTIPYWAIQGFSQVFWNEDNIARLLPTLGVLCGIALVALSVAWWRFKRGTIFEP